MANRISLIFVVALGSCGNAGRGSSVGEVASAGTEAPSGGGSIGSDTTDGSGSARPTTTGNLETSEGGPTQGSTDGDPPGEDRVRTTIRLSVREQPGQPTEIARSLPGSEGIDTGERDEVMGTAWARVVFDEGYAGWVDADYVEPIPTALRAFPTAEGFGAEAVGGRGGRAIHVTNTDDSGPGSLRACIEETGPRTCIFRVGGTITTTEPLAIRDPFVTIAGQTAPGDGIMLRNNGHGGTTLTILTHDVIVRHVRARAGDSSAPSCCVDVVGIFEGADRVMVDHVSASWSVDEVMSAYGARNFTIQWSILSEALDRANHGNGGRHSAGILTQDGGTASHTLHHNLFAHNGVRSPEVGAAEGEVVDVVNNVTYNPRSRIFDMSTYQDLLRGNAVANYLKRGPNSASGYAFVNARGDGPWSLFVVGNHDPADRPDDTLPEDLVLVPEHRQHLTPDRHPAPWVATTSAAYAFEAVLEGVGATKPVRDVVDTRVISEVRDGSGGHIDHQDEVGGFPTMVSGTPYPDEDADGIDDVWEEAAGLDPTDAADGAADPDGDGYTNLELFINELAGDPPP